MRRCAQCKCDIPNCTNDWGYKLGANMYFCTYGCMKAKQELIKIKQAETFARKALEKEQRKQSKINEQQEENTMSNLIATTSGNDYGALDGFKVFAPNNHSASADEPKEAVDVSKEAVDVSEQQTDIAQFVPPVFDENQVRLIRDLAEDRLVEVCEKGDVREMGLDGVIELAGVVKLLRACCAENGL